MGARHIIVMGVAGSGKSTIGAALAARLDRVFIDADDLHDDAARAKMAAGVGLSDADRAPWLERLRQHLLASPVGLTAACSALKQRHRAQLSEGLPAPPIWIWLRIDAATVQKRLAQRSGHFFPPSLAQSQFEALETPIEALAIDASAPEPEVIESCLRGLATIL